MALPTDDKDRKGLPVFRGPLMYFPDAILAVAAVCKAGNDQHNPGEPLHWARGKSMEQMDTALRHMMDHGLGNTKDVDGMWHLAKAAWRVLAELQLTIEAAAIREDVARSKGWTVTDCVIVPAEDDVIEDSEIFDAMTTEAFDLEPYEDLDVTTVFRRDETTPFEYAHEFARAFEAKVYRNELAGDGPISNGIPEDRSYDADTIELPQSSVKKRRTVSL